MGVHVGWQGKSEKTFRKKRAGITVLHVARASLRLTAWAASCKLTSLYTHHPNLCCSQWVRRGHCKVPPASFTDHDCSNPLHIYQLDFWLFVIDVVWPSYRQKPNVCMVCSCKYLLPPHGFSFISLFAVRGRGFWLWRSSHLLFAFCHPCFECDSHGFIAKTNVMKLFSAFSSLSFTVSLLTFKPWSILKWCLQPVQVKLPWMWRDDGAGTALLKKLNRRYLSILGAPMYASCLRVSHCVFLYWSHHLSFMYIHNSLTSVYFSSNNCALMP